MIRICDIIHTPHLADVTIIAGLNGQEREVRTVTVLDAPDGPRWLKGNELILSSAYLFEHNDKLLMEYAAELFRAGASGFGIKMGRFVSAIPREVEDFANKNNFPILKIPYKLVWTDIISTFYKLQYGLEQPRQVICCDPENVASLVEALQWNSRRFLERMSEIFSIPLLLADKNGVIGAVNDVTGIEAVKALFENQIGYPESAVQETYEQEGLFVSVLPLPALSPGKNEYLVFGAPAQENVREMARLLELMERFLSVESGSVWDERQRYRHFLTRVVRGKVTLDEIRAFERNRALSGYVYSGIMLLTGSNYQDVCDQIQEITRHMRLEKSAPLPFHMLYDQAAGEAVVLVEYRSDKPQPNINSWMRGLIAEVEDDLIAEGDGCIAISNLYAALEELPLCLEEARKTRQVGELLWKHHRKYSYTGMSVYIMLRGADLSRVDFNDIELLKNPGALPSFDGVKTSETYMECSNYKLAAKRLYIHENTLRYRIQKISELLNQNLEDPFVSHSILMKIKLWKLYHSGLNLDQASPPAYVRRVAGDSTVWLAQG